MDNSKTIAAGAYSIGHAEQKVVKTLTLRRHAQRGFTLVELLVGIVIGLLVVAVAAAALMVSRGVSGTVSDASGIQQQAAYALRVIGAQLRQASSLRLELEPTTKASSTATEKLLAPVAFTSKTNTGLPYPFDLDQPSSLFSGTDDSLTIGFARDRQDVFVDGDPMTLARNCRGGPSDISTDVTSNHERVSCVIQRTVDVKGNELLTCDGNGLGAQAIIQNVANFRVRYLVQDATSALGNPTIRYVDAATAGANWGRVQGVEICMVLYGNETIDLPTGSAYTDCDGTTKIDMTTLTGKRAKRMHLVFRNVFQLRSQGLV